MNRTQTMLVISNDRKYQYFHKIEEENQTMFPSVENPFVEFESKLCKQKMKRSRVSRELLAQSSPTLVISNDSEYQYFHKIEAENQRLFPSVESTFVAFKSKLC